MTKIRYDADQVKAAAILLAHLCDEQDSHRIEHMLVEMIHDAVATFGNESGEVNAEMVTAVIWLIPEDQQAKFDGCTHEVSLFINPIGSVQKNLVNPGTIEIAPHTPPFTTTGPGRLRYLHIRKYMSHFYNGQLLGTDLMHQGGYTVCFRDNQDGTLSYGVAKCRSDEHYVKHLGRQYSRNRMLTNPKTATMSIVQFRDWMDQLAQQGAL